MQISGLVESGLDVREDRIGGEDGATGTGIGEITCSPPTVLRPCCVYLSACDSSNAAWLSSAKLGTVGACHCSQ